MNLVEVWMIKVLLGEQTKKPGPVFTKGLSQGLGLKLRLLSQVSA